MPGSGSTPDKREIDALIEFIRANPFPEELEEAKVAIDALGTPVAEDITVERFEIDGVPCQMLSPAGADKERVVVYLHGGGYILGSLVSHAGMASEIGRAANCCVLQVDYRLAPVHSFPAPIEDASRVYRGLLNKGLEPQGLSLAGDSAGGGLVLATLTTLRDAGDPLPATAVCLSPWTDLLFTGESMQRCRDLDPVVDHDGLARMANLYMAGEDFAHPAASPLYADLHGLPPMLIQVGESEILFSDAERVAEKARHAGVDVVFEKWPDMIHGWHLFYPVLAEGRSALSRIGEFILKQTG